MFLQSSLVQHGGANLWSHCSRKLRITLNRWMGRPHLLPEIFEIVLRPIWWAAGCEQPSPPLHRAAAAQLLSCSDKYKSLYSTNMGAKIFLKLLRVWQDYTDQTVQFTKYCQAKFLGKVSFVVIFCTAYIFAKNPQIFTESLALFKKAVIIA